MNEQWNYTKYPFRRTIQTHLTNLASPCFACLPRENAVAIRSELRQSINQSINQSIERKDRFHWALHGAKRRCGLTLLFAFYCCLNCAVKHNPGNFHKSGISYYSLIDRSIDFSLLFWLHLNYLPLFYKKGLKMAQHNASAEGPEGPEGTVLELEQSRREMNIFKGEKSFDCSSCGTWRNGVCRRDWRGSRICGNQSGLIRESRPWFGGACFDGRATGAETGRCGSSAPGNLSLQKLYSRGGISHFRIAVLHLVSFKV